MTHSNDDLSKQIILNATTKLNLLFKDEGILFINNWKHIIKRAKERDINNLDIEEILNCFMNNNDNLMDFIMLVSMPYKERPFRIEIRNPKVIFMFSRMDDYKWKLNTVLDPKIHSKHRDKNSTFYGYIECKK